MTTLASFLFFSTLLSFASTQRNPCDSDVLFVLDGSGSVQGDFQTMRDFVQIMADLTSIKVNAHRVAFVEYSSTNRRIRWPLKEFGEITSNNDFRDFISKLPYLRGVTDTGHALQVAQKMLGKRRQNALTIVAVITDGFYRDADMVEKIAPQIQKMENVILYALAVPVKFNKENLIVITGDETRVIVPPNVEEQAKRLLDPVIGCRPPTRPPRTTTTPRPTQRQIVTTTTTKPPPTTQFISGCELDLLFIMDFSTSIEEIHQKYIREAVELLKDLRIGPHYTRVAMVKFSSKNRHEIVFHFNKHSNLEGIVKDIENAAYMGGTTWAGQAIILGMSAFAEENGARPDLAKQITIMYTDGYSQEDPADAARKMRLQGVEMFAVGLSQSDYDPDSNQLESIAGSDDRVYVNKNGDLAKRVAKLNKNCRD